MLLTLAFCGLRASEARALRWKDVDLKQGELHVRQRADAFNAIGQPKSHAGTRTVPLTPLVVNTLSAWQEDCPKGKLGLVFPTRSGAPDNHANIIVRGLIPAMEASNLMVPKLDDKGEPVRGKDGKPVIEAAAAVAAAAGKGRPRARLGHATLAMTADTYGHLFNPVDDRRAMAEGERRLLA